MKTYLLFIALFFSLLLTSQTAVPGGTISGVWTLAGSPYNVNGSLQVPNNDSLVIQPGVTVNFTGTHKIMVLGKLKAIGTAIDSIRFTCSNTATGWKGIRFNNTLATNDSSKLIYCRIEYGIASGPFPDDKGGALFLEGFSKFRLSHSTVINCKAASKAGGIYLRLSSPIITYNTISSNTTIPNGNFVDGGGITVVDGSPLIKGNLITKNMSASNDGGGISHSTGSSSIPVIISNTITNQVSGIVTEGMAPCFVQGNLITGHTIHGFAGWNCTVTANTLKNNGTGIDAANSRIENNLMENNGTGLRTTFSATVINNRIFNNHKGGIVIFNISNSSRFTNNIVANNSGINGAAISFNHSNSCELYNNTIVNNHASGNGGAFFFNGSSSPLIMNCIVSGNTAGGNGSQVFIQDELSDPDFKYNNIQGGNAGFALSPNIFHNGVYSNNMNVNPMLVSPSAGSGTVFSGGAADWRLLSGSPCIDAGSPAGSYPATDIAGNPRIAGPFIDMGAFEDPSISGLTGLTKNSELLIYPQPCSSTVRIRSASPVLSVQLFTQAGQKLQATMSEDGSIDVSSFANGIYFLEVSTNQGVAVKKVMVNR